MNLPQEFQQQSHGLTTRVPTTTHGLTTRVPSRTPEGIDSHSILNKHEPTFKFDSYSFPLPRPNLNSDWSKGRSKNRHFHVATYGGAMNNNPLYLRGNDRNYRHLPPPENPQKHDFYFNNRRPTLLHRRRNIEWSPWWLWLSSNRDTNKNHTDLNLQVFGNQQKVRDISITFEIMKTYLIHDQNLTLNYFAK